MTPRLLEEYNGEKGRFNIKGLSTISNVVHVTVIDRIIYLSGLLPLKIGEKEITGKGIREQAETAIQNLKIVLNFFSIDINHVIKGIAFLAYGDDMTGFAEVWANHFKDSPPCRTTISAGIPKKNALIELDFTLCLDLITQ